MSDLHIPGAAGRMTFACGCSESGTRTGYPPEAIPLIVATELRRLADEDVKRLNALDNIADAHRYRTAGLMEAEDAARKSRDRLRARADEIDGGAR